MSYQRATLELHGSYPDLIPQDAPATGWNTTFNVMFHNGQTRRVPGNTPVYTAPASAPLCTMFYTNAAGEHCWIYATTGGIFTIDAAGTHTITPLSGWAPTSLSIVTMDALGGVPIINDSVSGPFYWSGDALVRALALPNWPAGWRCMSMRAHKYFLMAIGRLDTAGRQRVSWSDAAEPGSLPAAWTPADTNLAGWVDLMPANSPCVDGFTLRDQFIVCKGESIHAMQLVDDTSVVFATAVRFNNIGLSGVGGWTMGPGDLALFASSDGGLYVTDGTDLKDVSDGSVRRTYYAEADPDQIRSVRAATLFREGISLIGYPTQGNGACNRALVYDWASGELGFRDLPSATAMAQGRFLQDTAPNAWNSDSRAWWADDGAWDFQLAPATGDDVIAGSAGGFWLLSGETANTVPQNVYLLKTGLAFGDAQARKLICRVWPKVDGRDGDTLTITVGGQETAGGLVTWSSPQTFTIGAGRPVEVFITGRYMALEIKADTGAAWTLGTFDVEFKGAGRW